ncbi:MAG TPA: NRDE family protein [Kofleriaceae bacterium]|nr:NRDE family protein [Kofleriaceae bacterium]
MCTIAILIEVVAGAPLVLAANRDELYARPARSPEVLRDVPRVVGGRDVQSQGTWLAVRGDGRFAAVTNQRALVAPAPGLVSRGHVVIETVAADDPDAYVSGLDATKYASMNLVWGDRAGARVAYTRHAEGTVDVMPLAPGIHVLCNDRIGADGFPRGERLADALAPLAGASLERVIATLPALLGDHAKSAAPASHLPPALAHELTATCIHSEHYGTRSASIVAFTPEGVTYLHADGPPCVTAFCDMHALL